tara:strand:- start:111928 stop:112476 length:549 start_codon:yes stop_codon:yes gene_type:complete
METNSPEQPVDWQEPDWRREQPRRFWDPSRKLLRSLRDYQRLQGTGWVRRIRRSACVIRHHFWSVVTGAEIPLNCQIEGGLLLPHPNGVVCHPEAKIGPNCLLFQQVTLTEGVILGAHVDVGAGAKVLGPLELADHVRIGANSVVLQSVPAGCTAVGVPAEIVRRPNATDVESFNHAEGDSH